jgi:predicted phage-related endonuclease
MQVYGLCATFTPKECTMTQLIAGEKFSADVAHNRNAGIGGSDARMIMEGKWRELWLQKTGRAPGPDLSDVFPVQLGSYTEQFHIAWSTRKRGIQLGEPQPFYVHQTMPHMFAHIDALCATDLCPIEAKHTNERETFRSQVEKYMPQLAHICCVTGSDGIWFSIIRGNLEPEIGFVEPPKDYIDKLIELERQFWWHVTEDEEPLDLDADVVAASAALGDAVRIDGLRAYDMTSNNAWAEHAASIIETQAAAKKYDASMKAIKELVPRDASECKGHGVLFKRDTRGALRITIA